MSDNPFKNFEEASVKPKISNNVIKLANNKINPNTMTLSLKYGALFIITIFFSLAICPQRGVGFIRDDFPLFHHLLHQSEVLCGLYCGFIFFLTTHLFAFFLLTHFERLKIVKTASFLPALFMSAFFGLSMTSVFSTESLGWTYNLSWIFIVGSSYYISNQLFVKFIKQP
ncbi:MAG: hypothetical protein ACRBBP_02485 [Bdellovibrionales bacterium]